MITFSRTFGSHTKKYIFEQMIPFWSFWSGLEWDRLSSLCVGKLKCACPENKKEETAVIGRETLLIQKNNFLHRARLVSFNHKNACRTLDDCSVWRGLACITHPLDLVNRFRMSIWLRELASILRRMEFVFTRSLRRRKLSVTFIPEDFCGLTDRPTENGSLSL